MDVDPPPGPPAIDLEASTPRLVELVLQHPASLDLYTAIHALFAPFLTPASPPIATLATYIATHLWPALKALPASTAGAPGVGGGADAVVSDAIIDVVWQLDQAYENGVADLVVAAQPVASTSTTSAPPPPGIVLEGQAPATSEAEYRSRLGELVKSLITANVLPVRDCRERFEASFLALPGLDLIPNQRNFQRLEVRARTALYYKQQKFNLLREETEGYSKLVVELLSNMGPPQSATTAQPQESEKQRLSRAKLVEDSVKSLIGNFDLDPDRTLDIVLDVFSDQLVKHHQFFIDFLSVSPWAPRRSTSTSPNAMDIDGANGKGKAKVVDVGLEDESGSSLMAQILGFKFFYYQSPGVEEAPPKLYQMAALLLWHGFVKLADLWPHLCPEDDEVLKTETRYRNEQEQLARSVGGANALAMAGALVDDDAPSSSKPSSSAPSASAAKTAADAQSQLPQQKLGLLRALLAIGDVPHAMFILSQFPALVPAHTDLADLLLRLLEPAFQPAYDAISIATSVKPDLFAEFTAPKLKYVPPKPAPTTTATGGSGDVAPVLTELAFPDPNKRTTFFFAGWKERLPLARDWNGVLDVLDVFMPFVGVFVSRNFTVYSKLCRIIKHDKEDGPRKARWFDFIRQYLLPGISLLEHHAAGTLELWTILEPLPTEKRYQLYGEWKDTLYRRIPALGVRKAEAERDVKSILRRLSTENVKKLGKTVAKVVHTNPTVVFAIVLNQVQSYDNLIVPVVDAARYLTEFGYDVLAYSVLDALCGPKEKTKDDGTSVAMWLQGLASFTGQLYLKWHPMGRSLPMILQYIVNQLAAGNSKDLVILRELITRMTGIEPFADLSDGQVMSLAGGKLLRSEVFFQTEIQQVSRRASYIAVINAKARLKSAVMDSGLAIPLLISIAIQRQASIANTDAHLKSLGGLFDQCHAVLFQYEEFLKDVVPADELAAMVPTVADLMETFGLDTAVAFDIGRPKLRLAMRLYDEKNAKEFKDRSEAAKIRLERAKALGQPAVEVASNETKPAIVKAEEKPVVARAEDQPVVLKVEEVSTPQGVDDPTSVDVEMVGVTTAVTPAAATTQAATPPIVVPKAPPLPWHPGLFDTIKTAESWLPESARSMMGAPFFVTFWQLTLYDLHCPTQRYEQEVTRLNKMQREVQAPLYVAKPDDKAKFCARLAALSEGLFKEAAAHQTAVAATEKRLNKEKMHWFTGTIKTSDDQLVLAQQMLQYCILPRAKLSLPDAVYSFKLLQRLHSLNTPAFHLIVLDNEFISNQIGPFIYSCSESEARNFARFLHDLLAELFAWDKDPVLFYKEAAGIPSGSLAPATPDGTPITVPPLRGFGRVTYAENGISESVLGHEEWRGILERWHIRLGNSFKLCLDSGEYMHIKNVILVMTKVAPVFPINSVTGNKLLLTVSTLAATETREDLKILASGLKAVLTKQRKNWTAPVVEGNKPPLAPQSPIAPSTPPSGAKPSPVPGASAVPIRPPPASVDPPTVGASAVASSVPSGPKAHGLPQKPGVSSSAPHPPALRSDMMDIDKPIPVAPELSRRQLSSNGSTPFPGPSRDAQIPPSGPRGGQMPPHSSLPQRPAATGMPSRPLSTSRSDEPHRNPNDPHRHPDRDSRHPDRDPRRSAAMDPPAAPFRQPASPNKPDPSPNRSHPNPQSDSRPTSPHHSDSGRRERGSERGQDKDDDPSSHSRSRDHGSADGRSSHHRSSDKDKERSSRNDRDRGEREKKDDKDRSSRDSKDSRPRRREDTDKQREPDRLRDSDRRRDDEKHRDDEKRRDDDKRSSSRRESDNPSETRRLSSTASKGGSSRPMESESRGGKYDESAGRSTANMAPKPSMLPDAPRAYRTSERSSQPRPPPGDRLKPAPAGLPPKIQPAPLPTFPPAVRGDAEPDRPPREPERLPRESERPPREPELRAGVDRSGSDRESDGAFSIKGRGAGSGPRSRLFAQAIVEKGEKGEGRSGGGLRGDRSGAGGDRSERERGDRGGFRDESRKRGASSAALADRLSLGKAGESFENTVSSEHSSKRPRTQDDGGRQPPPHIDRTQGSERGDRRSGGRR